ncbi:uncharacterized protein LOC119651217 [Hermetia illucens]|uniref:uncharacterized protein LOC119651217 n=1 Tax=Hermetia illucens TaxID=343691 RepID=UPI0018CBF4C1|nr:uncharacterized protein LOC119651217 [Hermetia illucens]
MELLNRKLVAIALTVLICLIGEDGPGASAIPWTINSNIRGVYNENFVRSFRNQSRLENYQMHGELMDTCYTTSDCRNFAYQCSEKNTCQCAQGYMPDEMRETCIGGIGSKCMYDSHCIPRAYCKGQLICACKHEFPIFSRDKWTCQGSGSHYLPNKFILAASVTMASYGVRTFLCST